MLNSKSKYAVAVLSMLLSITLAKSAFAGSHAEAMSEWAARVSEKISARMTYPRSAGGRSGYNVAELVVARDGTVIEATILEASAQPAINIATKMSLKRISRLPSPPKSLTGDQVRVRVFMIYADTPAGISRVEGRLVASRKDSPLALLPAGN